MGLPSLNPCFSGTYSQRVGSSIVSLKNDRVLILVLVEHTLRGEKIDYINQHKEES